MPLTAKEQDIVERSKLYRKDGNKGHFQYADPQHTGPSNAEMGASALTKGLGGLMTTGNPYVAAGMAGLDLYQSFKNQDASDKAYEQAKAQYNDQLNLNRDALNEQKKRQNIADIYTGSNFAGNYQDDLLAKYGSYNSMIGR